MNVQLQPADTLRFRTLVRQPVGPPLRRRQARFPRRRPSGTARGHRPGSSCRLPGGALGPEHGRSARARWAPHRGRDVLLPIRGPLSSLRGGRVAGPRRLRGEPAAAPHPVGRMRLRRGGLHPCHPLSASTSRTSSRGTSRSAGLTSTHRRSRRPHWLATRHGRSVRPPPMCASDTSSRAVESSFWTRGCDRPSRSRSETWSTTTRPSGDRTPSTSSSVGT